jgi:hypothetical protein
MPTLPLPPCRHPRCRNRSDCPVHARPSTPSAKGYGSRWRRYRADVIKAYQLEFCGDRPAGAPLTSDSQCRPRNIGKVLDHIERVSGPNDPRFFNARGMQFLCDACHQVKRQREAQEPPIISGTPSESITWG